MAQNCELATLTTGGGPFRALSRHELRAARLILKAKALNAQDAGISADLATLAEATSAWVSIPADQKAQILTYLSYQSAVDAGAVLSDGEPATLIGLAKLWAHKSEEELSAIELYLDCQEVNIGGATL